MEAPSGTAAGNLIIDFRGPLSDKGGALALEIKMPASAEDEPVLVVDDLKAMILIATER